MTRNLRYSNDPYVDLKLIDIGSILKRKASEILYLTDEFRTYPPQALDMHLIGLVPADLEDEWDLQITNKVKQCVDNYTKIKENIKIEANVLFTLQNTVIVDCVRITKINGNDTIIMCSIKKFMIDRKLGISSKSGRLRVLEMVKNFGNNETIQKFFLIF